MECRLASRDYVEVERALREAFTRVFGDRLVALVLYGSYARREARCDSDIDIIVVVEDGVDRLEAHRLIDVVEDELRERLRHLVSRGVGLLLSPHILPRSAAARFRPLYIDVVFDARILFDRDGFMEEVFSRVRRTLESLGARRIRLWRGWVVVLKERVRPGERIVLE